MIRAAIQGGTGYTALELLRILLRHPGVEVTAVTSRSETGLVSRVHPSLAGRLNLVFSNPTPDELAGQADVCFCCLPHVASMEAIPSLLAAGLRVIDLSADYRLTDPVVYETWYGHVHTDPTRLGATVYGLPEIYGDRIASQNLIANPGCYTSTSILALAPLLKAGLVRPKGIIIDAKSGVSGAGRSPKVEMLYSECNESFSAYAVGTHRHTPEIEQVLSDVCGEQVDVIFTPHLTPMDRGIFATIYAVPAREVKQAELLETMRQFYAGKPFVHVVEHLPKTKDVSGTNFCHLTARVVKDRVMVLAVLDNLIKGASGVAVQNFNLMYDFDETTGLV
ncbi:N-acetyl-gamma-glutamyl-phosphate reductase [Planctomicrobium piriforme]|uniref:N-acetyl-gamma-glutamyl-phosphate reductase n=1 Tax=Planctomicrobium piriforme TaxID=1576369 RepID=A0A1I3GQ25_9PLAN|nr:N-acetyl-gamma-glutamyl-phosphate reductase [Planctomicrobium piriforme]SFI25526.1 N-acetyl-gamma-glutamyl-phosphate reductase [Planctomicrobium piriforme]